MTDIISAAEFRQRLAGLTSPGQLLTKEQNSAAKDDAVRFAVICADIFGDALDRKSMWDRLASGIDTSAAKSGGNWEKFIELMLSHVKAEATRAASSDSLAAFYTAMRDKTHDEQQAFIRASRDYKMLVLLEARAQRQIARAVQEDGAIVVKADSNLERWIQNERN